MVLLHPKAFEISLWDFPILFRAEILPYSISDNLVPLVIYIFSTVWNDKIVALEKTTWFHFRLMKTGFLFLLQTSCVQIPKSDRSLLLCLKVTQCSTSEIGDAPLYNLCPLQIQVMTTGPLPAPSKCKPGRFNAWGQSSMHRTTLWRWWGGRPHHATSYLRSRLESQHQSVLDVLKSAVIPCCNQVAGGRPWVWLQDSALAHKSRETQAWLQKQCYNFVPFSHWPPFSPDLHPLDYFVWSYVENITNMISHHTKASLITAIRRRLWKRHVPSSGSVSRPWLRLKAATLNRCQLYYITKLPELIFSIKVLK